MSAGAPGTFTVKCVRIPGHMPWYTRFAAHCWFDLVPETRGEWVRLEIVAPSRAAEALDRMLERGSRLPWAECQRRFRLWEGH